MRTNPTKLIRRLALTLAIASASVCAFAQSNPSPQPLPYSQDFSGLAWTATAYPAGWQGWSNAAAPSGSFLLTGPLGDKALVASASGSSTSGAVDNFNGAIGFLNSGSVDLSLGLALNTSGYQSVQVQYDIGTIRNPYDGVNNTRINEVTLQYRVGTSGAWTSLTGIEYQNNTMAQTSGTTFQNPQTKTIGLPSACDNQPVVQVRWESRQVSGSGSRPSFAVDNISVTGTALPVGVAPQISNISPSSVVTNAASTVAYTVTVSAGDQPLGFFWYKEQGATTNNIAGQTNATLTLANVLMTDTASYQVIVSNAYGTATSSIVSLSVIDPALITSPLSQTNLLNSSTMLSIGVTGTQPLTYQWYRGTPDGANVVVSDSARVAGSQSNILTITNLTYADADNYFAIATNIYGAVTSSVATLTITNIGVLAYWDFNTLGISPTNPAPAYGPIGAASGLRGTTNGFITFTGTANDPITSVFGVTNYYWGASTYPSATTSNKQAGIEFKVSTVGLRNVTIAYDERGSATASRYQRLQFTTNGTDYIDFPGSTDINPNGLTTGNTGFRSEAFSLVGFPGTRDNPNFGIRIVTEFESTAKYGATNNDAYVANTSTYGSSGVLGKDIVTFNAESITNGSTPPTITTLADVTNVYNAPFTINFTVGDAETAAGSLTVTANSFNQSVVSDGNIVPGGSGASRNIQINPSAIGKAPILVTVTDANGDSTAAWFMLTTIPSDYPPTISLLPAHTNGMGNAAINIPFSIADDHASASTLYTSLSASSGNQTLVPNANITFGGSGNNPILIVTPVTGQVGVAPITVSVNDGVNPATSQSFTLMVCTNASVVLNDSFDYDTSGNLTSVSLGLWQAHSSANNGPVQVASGSITVNGNNSEDVNAPLLGAPYMTNSSSILYSSFKVNFSVLPTTAGQYFAHFKDDTTFGFMGRVWASTLNATSGSYRLGIGNGSGTTNSTAQFPLDLSIGTTYTIVTRLDVSNAVATMWINPTSFSDTHVSDSTVLDPTNHFNIFSYAFRQSSSEGTMTIDDLKVGTTFTAVTGLASGPAPSPTIQNISIEGGNIIVRGTNNNTSGGQTYYILASTNLTLPLAQWTPIATNTFSGTGAFSATNALGGDAQRYYLLQVP